MTRPCPATELAVRAGATMRRRAGSARLGQGASIAAWPPAVHCGPRPMNGLGLPSSMTLMQGQVRRTPRLKFRTRRRARAGYDEEESQVPCRIGRRMPAADGDAWQWLRSRFRHSSPRSSAWPGFEGTREPAPGRDRRRSDGPGDSMQRPCSLLLAGPAQVHAGCRAAQPFAAFALPSASQSSHPWNRSGASRSRSFSRSFHASRQRARRQSMLS